MTTASDNVFPKVIIQEAAAPSSPSATQFKLYVDSADHLLKYKNSAGTVTTLGAGLADPMTTRGDIIIRNASNVTARLGIGSSGKVLQSDGTDISWQTPAASGGPSAASFNLEKWSVNAGQGYITPMYEAQGTGTFNASVIATAGGGATFLNIFKNAVRQQQLTASGGSATYTFTGISVVAGDQLYIACSNGGGITITGGSVSLTQGLIPLGVVVSNPFV